MKIFFIEIQMMDRILQIQSTCRKFKWFLSDRVRKKSKQFQIGIPTKLKKQLCQNEDPQVKKTYKCEYCSRTFEDGRQLGGHTSRAHMNFKKIKDSPKKLIRKNNIKTQRMKEEQLSQEQIQEKNSDKDFSKNKDSQQIKYLKQQRIESQIKQQDSDIPIEKQIIRKKRRPYKKRIKVKQQHISSEYQDNKSQNQANHSKQLQKHKKITKKTKYSPIINYHRKQLRSQQKQLLYEQSSAQQQKQWIKQQYLPQQQEIQLELQQDLKLQQERMESQRQDQEQEQTDMKQQENGFAQFGYNQDLQNPIFNNHRNNYNNNDGIDDSDGNDDDFCNQHL